MTAYAERCRCGYYGLKEIAHAEALERSIEECVVTEVVAPVPRFSTRPTTIQTARSSRHIVTSERDQLMKKGRCFSCKEVGHRTMDCPINKRKLKSKLAVSRMVVQEPEVEKPRAEKPHDEEPLIILSSSLPGDFFAKEALVTSCMLGNSNKIKTTALLDTGATGYLFVDPSMARRICDNLLIEPIRLSKPKAIHGFNGKQAPNVTHAIYSTMTVKDHRETTTSMLITKLGQHQIILGKPWMKKHGALLDMRTDRLSFWPGHYQHNVALRLPPAEPCTEELQPRAKESHEELSVEEPRASGLITILKRPSSNELPESLLPYLLPNTRGVSKVANTPEAVKPQEKKKKPSTILKKPKPNAKDKAKVEDKKPSVERVDSKPLDLAFIGGAPFMRLAKSKKPEQRAEIFAISMRDIEYQLNKTTKPPTDSKTVVPAEYHDFLDVFLKDISDTLRPYGKYDHKIELLKDKNLSDLGHSALRGMSTPQLEFVKKFLEEHLKKRFIEASSAPCSSPILLAKKPGGGIRFCVDYRKLNSLTKKDAYPLPLIAETMARLKKAIVFTKIDIRQAFHKLRMAIESEDATMFTSRFGAYKWKIMLFGLTGGPASWQRFINDLL